MRETFNRDCDHLPRDVVILLGKINSLNRYFHTLLVYCLKVSLRRSLFEEVLKHRNVSIALSRK